MVTILIMSVKLATLGLLKSKVFQNKGYNVIILSMTSSTQFYHVTQIILQMWPCEFFRDLTRKTNIFEEWA